MRLLWLQMLGDPPSSVALSSYLGCTLIYSCIAHAQQVSLRVTQRTLISLCVRVHVAMFILIVSYCIIPPLGLFDDSLIV